MCSRMITCDSAVTITICDSVLLRIWAQVDGATSGLLLVAMGIDIESTVIGQS